MENKKVKILAIDDNRDNLISIKAILSDVIPQSVIYLEESGQRGIESAKKNDPDVILLDIVMPGMDGYEVCKILKDDEQLRETPIIFLTALKGDKQSRILAFEAGGEAFLAKPIDSTELKAQIFSMLKIKEAFTYKRDQRVQLEDLVQKRTEELKGANIAALNLMEDLNAEIEIRKQREEALKESERQYAFLAGTAFDLVKFTSTQNIYEYVARKLYELMENEGIVAIVEYDADSTRWKIQHLEGIQNKLDELAKIFGFDIRKLDGEISSKYYDKIVGGKLEEVELDFPGLFNNKVSDIIGKAVKKLLSIDKLYCIAFQESEKKIGNITLVTKKNTKPLNAVLIEAFVLQVSNFIKKQKSEEALKESEERFRVAQEFSPDGFSIFHPVRNEKNEIIDFTWVYENQTIARINGTDPKEVIGKRLLALFPTHKKTSVFEAYINVANSKKPLILEEVYVGEILSTPTWLRLVVVPMSTDIAILAQDITERKQAEEKEKELLNRYELISLHLPGVIYQFRLRPDGSFHFPYASHGIYNIYGVHPKDVEHDAITAFKAIHPDDLEQVSVSINHSAQTLTPWHDIYRTNQPSGKTIWVEGNSTPQKLEDGSIIWHGFIQDITKRKQAEEKLKLLNRAVESSSVAVEITDAEGNINYINPFFTELTGYSYEEVLGKNPRFLKSGHHPKTFYEELWNTILSGREWTGEFQNKKKNGELYWEKAVISPILNSKRIVTNFVAIKEDITERKKILVELVAAKEKAEESDRLKSAFLANMSHEIRTPMNGILGFAELLKQPGLTGETQQEYIRIIEKSGDRMLNIINDIMSISKIESGVLDIHLSEMNINNQLQFVYDLLRLYADKKKLNLSFNCKLTDKEAIIKTDSDKFYGILSNLVKNAIKYTDEGTIEYGYNIKAKELEFYVKDTGIGIPKDRQEAIFERFIQADIADKMARQGAGLGLAISKAYATILGGKIWVESEEGKGSVFYFTLPYNNQPVAETIDGQHEPSGEDETVRKLKILIAEDDKVSEMLVESLIKMFSKEILIARTGIEAVEACRTNPDIDLILMDIRMPELGGYGATKQIREFNKEVIIIAQTAYGLSGDREKAIDAGCNDYIKKPINKTELNSLIQKRFKL